MSSKTGPKGEIPLGQSTPVGGATKTTYTYEDNANVDGKNAVKIKVDGTVTYNLPKGDGDAASVPFRVTKGKIEGKPTKGTLHFDPEAGRLLLAESRMTLEGTLTLAVGGNTFDTEVKLDLTSKTTLLKEKPKE